MSVTALSALTTSGQSQANKTIAGNFDTFLSLLTTQLKNQNPLEPLDTNEFTAQLVQFSSVEQSIKTNSNLEQLLAVSAANALSGIVDYVGKTVSAEGNQVELQNGTAEWPLNAASSSQDATVTIRDSGGSVVFTDQIALNQGANTYRWDGRTTTGARLTSGTFTISVSAQNDAGNVVNVDTGVTGVVDGIDLTGPEPLLRIGNSTVLLSNIRTISQT